ncbi:MAG: LptA/OstA family protein, partial [Pseudomonadota bacterium]
AMQGGFGIKTEVLRAKYSGSAGGALQGASGDSTAEGRPANAQLESIHAPGRIIVTSRDGQKAEGDSGIFDYKKNEVLLDGNVLLKQGRQLIRGERLRIDLKSGLSRIETKSGPAWSSVMRDRKGTATPAGLQPKGLHDAANRRACGGRMCAMFFPGDLQKQQKAKRKGATTTRAPKKQAPAAIGSGWSASTQSN